MDEAKSKGAKRNYVAHAGGIGSLPRSSDLGEALEELKPPSHLCLVYDSPEEWRATIIPFLKIGLKRSEKCFYITDAHTANEVRSYLRQEGLDVAAFEAKDQLVILHQSDVYIQEGSFDPDRMIALLIAETKKAIASGYSALRAAGEMSWVLRGYSGSEKLIEYEAKLNRNFFPNYPCVAICQYDRRKFLPETIKNVIMTHPLLVYRNHIYHNFYYIPPEEFLTQRSAKQELQYLLNNIERICESEEALRRDKQEKIAIMDSMLELVIYQDIKNRILWANRAAGKSVGLTPEQLVGRHCYEIWHQRNKPCKGCPIAKAYKTGQPQQGEIRTPDGRIWFIQGSPIRGENGNVLGAVEIVLDITKRKKMEDQLKASLKEKEVLLWEMHHRIKNNLQVVSSLLNIQAHSTKDKKTIDILSESKDRINTIALIHSQLYESKNLSEISMKSFVEKLLTQLLQSYPVKDKKITLVVHIDDYPFPVSIAVPVGLIVNELLTNTFKYAFDKRKKGKIEVVLSATKKGEINFTVSDDGVGLPRGFDINTTKTMGLSLVKILVEDQLQGTLDIINKEGTTFNIKFKIKK